MISYFDDLETPLGSKQGYDKILHLKLIITSLCITMDKSCEKQTRSVRLNKDALTITLIDCGRCEVCQRDTDDIRVVHVVKSDAEMKSAYTRWLAKREKFITKVITLD